MNKKTIIWFLGSNASGKTTQSKLLHKVFGNDEKKSYHMNDGFNKIKYTTFGNNIGHVGLVGDNQCTGTDTIGDKNSLEASLLFCLSECEIVLVDGIMATFQWLNLFQQFLNTAKVDVILLQFPTLEDNLKRVCERRVYKDIEKGGNDGADIMDFDMLVDYKISKLEEKTKKNVGSKFKGFKTMFEKAKPFCNKTIEINASQTIDEIHNQILNFIINE